MSLRAELGEKTIILHAAEAAWLPPLHNKNKGCSRCHNAGFIKTSGSLNLLPLLLLRKVIVRGVCEGSVGCLLSNNEPLNYT